MVKTAEMESARSERTADASSAVRRSFWLDLIYPRSCEVCGAPSDSESRYICWNCRAAITWVQLPFCARCGDPVAGRVDVAYVCYACADTEPGFDCARSAGRYTGPLRHLLQQFKYHEALWLAYDLGAILAACAISQGLVEGVDAVAWVPLYRARQRTRGFNQARVLASELARRLKVPLAPACCRRVRPTPTQTHLTARQRTDNVRGVFSAARRRWLEGRRLLLVDDVMTTGATVSECARVLKAGGAARVDVVTVARG